MENCCYTLKCCLAILDKLQKWICRAIGSELVNCLEALALYGNVVSLNLFHRYFFGRCLSQEAELFSLPHLSGRFNCYFNRWRDYPVTIPRCYNISKSAVSFLAQLNSRILS